MAPIGKPGKPPPIAAYSYPLQEVLQPTKIKKGESYSENRFRFGIFTVIQTLFKVTLKLTNWFLEIRLINSDYLKFCNPF